MGRSPTTLEERIGRLLRVMVAAAVTVVALGAVLYLVRHGAEMVSFSTFAPGPLDLRRPIRIVAKAFTLDPAAVIQFGHPDPAAHAGGASGPLRGHLCAEP